MACDNREDDHRAGGDSRGEEPQLQHVPEQPALGGPFPEIGENERGHAEIGERAEYGVIAL